MGRLAADAVAARDYPVVVATTLVAATLVVAGSLVADVAINALDPRLRRAKAR
ncbi:Nickel transport system permease protein NikB [compost metagenome]